MRFNRVYNQYVHDKDDNTVNDFVEDLSNNNYHHYDEDNYREGNESLDIEVIGDNIKIWNQVSEVTFYLENKTRLIEVMKKYQLLLNTYII